MNRHLRRRHWRWMVFLAVILPLLLALFLGRRDFTPHHSPVPVEIHDPVSTPAAERQ